MRGKEFITTLTTGVIGMTTLSAFNRFTDGLKPQPGLMPVLFIGHGSPMNGIQDNEFSRKWKDLGREIPTPVAVLVISAHWLTRGTNVTAMNFPKTIHDFGGFPEELFAVQYKVPGDPVLAKETAELVKSTQVGLDHDWGLDHGAWTVVRHMYPGANIPILQLSIDYTRGPEHHYELARELYSLRSRGVLIIGSGNMVHNLRMVAWDRLDEAYGFDWALEANDAFKSLIGSRDHKQLMNYEGLGQAVKLAVPTPDHYLPLMYALGLSSSKDPVNFFNDKAMAGSLTMTSVRFG